MKLFHWIAVATIALMAPISTTSAFEATPSDVYAAVERLNRSVLVVLKARGVTPPVAPQAFEKGLGPMHVYQLHLACLNSLQQFEAQAKITQIPLIVGRPMKYTPTDVLMLTQLMTADVARVASLLEITGLPKETGKFSGKNPDDVFQEVLKLYVNLNALSGKTKITPNEVYAEMLRAVSDAKSVLAQIDTALRYRIDAPNDATEKTPRDVFQQCLLVRATINEARRELKLGTTPTPTLTVAQKLTPQDVFVQTQIIIAELNLIKLGTGTGNATPLAKPTSGKTPANVYQQVAALDYLLKQIQEMRQLAGNEKPAL